MNFAHFSHIWGKPGMTPYQRYEELWRELELCDRARLRLQLLRRTPLPAGRELDVVAESLRGRCRCAHQDACALDRWGTSSRSTIRCASRKRSPSSTRCWAAVWSLASCPASTPTIFVRSASITATANRRRSSSSITCAPPSARRSRSPSMVRSSTPTMPKSRYSRRSDRIRRCG